jgi:drug/metabolite transporter (DMT)-like permease
MNGPDRQPWLGTALVAGGAYFAIGLVFAGFAARVSDHDPVMWRLTAWAASAVVFAAHLGHEYFRMRHRPRITAWHAAVAVAVGAFLLAAAAGVHALHGSTSPRHLYMLALVAWLLATAVPAFAVAWLAATGLWLARRSN